MPSKTSKRRQTPRQSQSKHPTSITWKDAQDCSEDGLKKIVELFAKEITASQKTSRVIVCLEGELGTGKNTFARALIQSLADSRDSKVPIGGSPSFPVIQSYSFDNRNIHHADLYRLKEEREIFDTGLEDLIWNSSSSLWTLIVIEWPGLWPDFYRSIQMRNGFGAETKTYLVRLDFSSEGLETQRNLEIREWKA